MANGLPELQFMDLSQIDARATQARAAEQNMRLHQMQMQEAQRQMDQEAQLAQMFKSGQVDTSDPLKIFGQVAGVSPRMAGPMGSNLAHMMQYKEAAYARQQAAAKQQFDMDEKERVQAVHTLGGLLYNMPDDQAASIYSQLHTKISASNPRIAKQFPPTWNRPILQTMFDSLRSADSLAKGDESKAIIPTDMEYVGPDGVARPLGRQGGELVPMDQVPIRGITTPQRTVPVSPQVPQQPPESTMRIPDPTGERRKELQAGVDEIDRRIAASPSVPGPTTQAPVAAPGVPITPGIRVRQKETSEAGKPTFGEANAIAKKKDEVAKAEGTPRELTPEEREDAILEFHGQKAGAVQEAKRLGVDIPSLAESVYSGDLAQLSVIGSFGLPLRAAVQAEVKKVAAREKLRSEGIDREPTPEEVKRAKFDFSKLDANYKWETNPNNLRTQSMLTAALPRLQALERQIAPLKNTDITEYNNVQAWISKNLGKDAYTNFNSNKAAIIQEINTALSGSATGSDLRVNIELENLKESNSPKQLIGAINNLKAACLSRLDSSLSVPWPHEVITGKMSESEHRESLMKKYSGAHESKIVTPQGSAATPKASTPAPSQPKDSYETFVNNIVKANGGARPPEEYLVNAYGKYFEAK